MNAEEKFFARVAGQPGHDECWNWTGWTVNGYSVFNDAGRKVRAHRWAYEFLLVDIPAGLDLDHLCRNRACVNPWHMDPVTRSVNLARSPLVGGCKRSQTECKRGHALTGDNLYVFRNGQRRCRTCAAGWQRARLARNK